MSKYVRVMEGLKSNANGFQYKLNEVNIAETWNPNTYNPKEREKVNPNNDDTNIIHDILKEIQSSVDINLYIDKEPYIKKLSNDNVINITGESGSGKSYFSNKYIRDDNYIVIDTDVVFSDKPSDNKESVELRTVFSDKSKDYLFTDFDEFYLRILDYFKDSDKIIVIDSAQYRNIKDYSILKGQLIVMRTSVETCYERTLNRWKSKNEFDEEEFNKFAEKKKGMFSWYKGLNQFLEEIDKL